MILGNLLVVPHRGLAAVRAAALPADDADAAAAAQARDRLLPRPRPGRRSGQRPAGRGHAAHALARRSPAAFGETSCPATVGRHGDRHRSAGGARPRAGGGTGTFSAPARALIARANTEFNAAQDALKAGDFAEYGRQIDALKRVLSATCSACGSSSGRRTFPLPSPAPRRGRVRVPRA